MSVEEAREDGDVGTGVGDPRNAEPRLEITDPGIRDAETQASGHVESPWADVLEARRHRQLVPAVCRTVAVAQLPGEFRSAATRTEPASKLRDRIPGEGGRVRERLLSARKSLRADLRRWLHGLVALSTF